MFSINFEMNYLKKILNYQMNDFAPTFGFVSILFYLLFFW